jgi:metal-responsive CopG/Arc/MetJ family transcriptional regulator
MNKKLYSFRFNTDLISQIDELAKEHYMNRTQFITVLLANEIRTKTDLCETTTNPPVCNSLQS